MDENASSNEIYLFVEIVRTRNDPDFLPSWRVLATLLESGSKERGEGKPGGTKREGESLISAVSGRSENETRFVIVVVELRRRISSKWNDVADRFRGTEVSHDLREEGSSERWKYASVPSA